MLTAYKILAGITVRTPGRLRLRWGVVLTLSLLMSYIYGTPCKARNFNVVYTCMYGLTFGKDESRLFLFTAQCFNIDSMQKVFLCHSCV
jgi:hypothetical protein